ncbi:Hypothetical protein I5071_72510 [Sandaracinus amylolyticus]|nr:Hypothetical protein I5071_72510 [Sandaracinus amylolyticus]
MTSPTSSSEITEDSDATELALRRSGMFQGSSRASTLTSSGPQSDEDDGPTLLESRKNLQSLQPELLADRYESRSVLGEGGMGEVRLVWDRIVGREVAMKVLLPTRSGRSRAKERFLREAHVQGYLDHPGIVPVHEVGTLPSGEPFFTMKRIRGVTLHEVLEGLRKNDPNLRSRFSRRRMLSAFSKACLAIDYAHARGVVHRDLKPENVMLGDFGEVYVLDWGVARIVGTQVQRMPMALLGSITRAEQDLLGTPGYMAPEQIDRSNDADSAADVYSLGTILFEVLTLQALHRGKSVRELMISTREGADARCSVRAPQAAVAPELEAICVRATHADPLKRPQARELHEAIESFLDGDRETARRKLVADLHLRAAKETLKRASGTSGAEGATAQRDAIRGLARALSADPSNPEALQQLLDALAKPLDGKLPEEAEAEVREEEEKQHRVASRALRAGRFSWLLYVPLVVWLGPRDLVLGFTALGAIIAAVLVSWIVDLLPKPRPWMRTAVAVFAMLTIMPIASLFSPLILLPAIAAASIPTFMVHLDRPGRWITTAAACIAATLPFALEVAGVIPPSVLIRDGAITILPRMTHFPEWPTRIVLLVLSMSPLLTSAILMGRVRWELDAARRRVHWHLWRLRQLMP